jgi:hypothetical protein
MASEIIGVKIPDRTFDRLRSAQDESAEALTITLEIADWLRSRVSGLQITWLHGTPGGAERLLSALASRAAGAMSKETRNV